MSIFQIAEGIEISENRYFRKKFLKNGCFSKPVNRAFLQIAIFGLYKNGIFFLRRVPVVVAMQPKEQRLPLNWPGTLAWFRRAVGNSLQALVRPEVVVILNVCFHYSP